MPRMNDYINENNNNMEEGLILLINEYLEDTEVYFEEDEYYRLNFNIWDKDKFITFKKSFEFKDIGNSYDYPKIMPQRESFTDSDIYNIFKDQNKIAISEKYNAAIIYSILRYGVNIFCIIDKGHYVKFNKKLVTIVSSSGRSGIFNNVDFSCKKKEFIEICAPINEDDKMVSIQKKKIPKEKLVFDTNSEIFNVMEDIKTFFTKESKKLYEKMNILYRRGIIIYGDPGNGKTAMIRELIRQLSNVTCIIINPNTPHITFILSELIEGLKGRPSIIVIEDIDSIINSSNRSEFLNILDGVNIKSGVYFIGTTNYPERIDPAFINRSGRFDRSYKIDNPNEILRRAFFTNCKINEILSDHIKYKEDSENSSLTVIDLFVKFSEGLSMANLKELMLTVKYKLVSNKNLSIEEALDTVSKLIINNKTEHDDNYNRNYMRDSARRRIRSYNDEEE